MDELLKMRDKLPDGPEAQESLQRSRSGGMLKFFLRDRGEVQCTRSRDGVTGLLRELYGASDLLIRAGGVVHIYVEPHHKGAWIGNSAFVAKAIANIYGATETVVHELGAPRIKPNI